MELPDDQIGISDLKDWQDCPRRMSFSMKRHTGQEPPEATANPNVRYGTAVHDGIEWIEDTGGDPIEAVKHLMSNGHRWIDPEVAKEIAEDLATHIERDDPLHWELIWNEREIRVPLMVYEGRQIYYRAKIDRLYRHRTTPGLYWLRDSKSSRWPKTREEVDHDKQMSAYDWAVREYLPEVDDLRISYDQLRFGEIPTRRSDDERQDIKQWMEMATIAVLEDEDYGPDGLLVPSWNEWCAYCPIMNDCAVVPMLSNFAQAEIAAIAPTVKEGRTLRADLDPDLFEVYVDQLEKVSAAKGVLERFEKAVKARLQQMPVAERERHGYKLQTRSVDVFSPEALRAAHRLLGDDFYGVVTMSKTALTRAVNDGAKLKLIVGTADKLTGSTFVVKRRGGPSRR